MSTANMVIVVTFRYQESVKVIADFMTRQGPVLSYLYEGADAEALLAGVDPKNLRGLLITPQEKERYRRQMQG